MKTYDVVLATGTRKTYDTLKEAKENAVKESIKHGICGIFAHDKDGLVQLVIFYDNGKIDDVEDFNL